MRFRRCCFRPRKEQDFSSRQEQNLLKAVEREARDMPLFPELRKFRTAVERKQQIINSHNAWVKQFRLHQATAWREARRLLKQHPQKDLVTASWNRGWLPPDSNYLLSLIRNPRA